MASSAAIVVLCVCAFLLIVGGILFALWNKQTGYAAFGVISVGLVAIGILILWLWF